MHSKQRERTNEGRERGSEGGVEGQGEVKGAAETNSIASSQMQEG